MLKSTKLKNTLLVGTTTILVSCGGQNEIKMGSYAYDAEKLFKFYSKIILWQRYASWLRACQPCIHSQWSVS